TPTTARTWCASCARRSPGASAGAVKRAVRLSASAHPALAPPAWLRLPAGEVDERRTRWLQRELRVLSLSPARRVVVDLSEIAELTPALVGVLVHAHRRLEWHNASL